MTSHSLVRQRCTMADEDDVISIDELILDLASSRTDGIPVRNRNDLIQQASGRFVESADDRLDLAGLDDLKCSTKYAYQRIVGLFCVAINKEDDKDVQSQLCKELCRLLGLSGNLKLVAECRQALPLDKLTETFSAIANDSGIPAMSLAPSDWQIFVKHALGDTVASAMEMEMCEPMLKSIPFSDWEETVAPALILKLKSQPETASEMAEGLTKCINPDVIVQSKVVVDDLLPVLTKNAKSPKENIRQVSASILLNLASATIRASNQEDAKKCLEAIVTALADTKSLAQAYQRETVYTILKTIAATITKETAVDTKVISKVLQGVCTPLAKETKAATQAREEGLEALLRWMVVAKRNGGSTGYDEALTFVRAPVIAKNGADSLIMLGTLVQLLHPDLVESLVFDLWSDSKFVIGLEALVEAANKKHDSKSAAPPAEGLIAVYLSLVQASASSSKKLSDTFDKALSAGSAVTSKTSFVYGKAVTDSVTTHPLVSQILPRIIVMYAKLNAKSIVAFNDKPSAAVTKAMACSIAHPTISVGQSPTQAIESAAQTLLDYQPAADALVEALFAHVNRLSLDAQEVADSLNATRQARERDDNTSIKGKGSPTGYHSGMDINSIRRVARKLAARSTTPKGLAMALVLMHTGSSLRTNGKQRTSLVHYTTEVLKDIVLPQWKNMQSFLTAVADLVAEHASFAKLPAEEDSSISETLHLGALSLVTSLGGIGSNFEPANDDPEDVEMRPFVFAYKLCTKEIATRLAENVKTVISKLEALTENQIDVYKTPVGTLYRGDARSSSGTEKKARGKGRLSEDEQWELQMQEELAKKQEAPSGSLSADEKKLLHAQDADRQRMSTILKGDFVRMMAAVENLALSDIEIGNVCLPLVSEGVLTVAVSDCPATKSLPILKAKSLATLTTLATCVYEIQEEFASMMATALVVSCQYKIDPDDPLAKKSNSSEGLDISALPSPCEPAASTIFEMDEFQDELSGPSFAFLFPVVRAALMGPRTTPGCEGALRVLERHTKLLAGEEEDSVVVPLRKDMVASVLELLKHDRAQTFVDPTPFDTLVACYQTNEDNPGPALATSELAALLDERGALGSKSCRIAAMLAIGSIASRHPKLVKNNPLIENRIWLNCFENNEDIRKEARNTWGIVHGVAGLAEADRNSPLPPPSPVYAIPLLPLLSNVNESIAAAAAVAYAQGMAAHPKSVNKNIQKICSTYIESVPVAADEGAKSSSPFPTTSISAKIPVAAPKKPIGVPAALRKKTVKTSALAVAGIGGPKKTKKKSPSVNSALLKPKQERTFDHDALASQFQTGPKKAPPEKDSPAKVATRMGVLHAVSALTSTSVEMEMPTLTLLTSFLIAYGIADSDDGVKGISRNALRDIVATYGESDEAIAFLLPHLDHVLKTGLADEDTLGALPADKMPREGAAKDRRKEGAVVALGSVALHLKGPENVGKIDTTIDMLLQSLKTPSDDVQSSVADCLAKLMKKGNTQERIEAILDDLMKDCLDSDSAAVRRGAGYGISAAVKGSGIATLKKFGIVTKLEESCSNGSSSSKEGSLFAIELLCKRLGLLFEPYVIVLLPSLLRSFSDTSDRVREAASNTVGLIMSKLSAHGVKLVMPAVLTAFEDKSWRTKQASIHMLGSMSHLAPKQLASALPKVVPKLTEAFADTHPKVKESAQKALDEISTVIKNPEISSIASTLLKALTDPANSTILALEELIQTEFLHAIDAPSLALIVPILHRGLRDRAAITKRYGALIAGNICTMINDPRDFVPYIPTLIPDLKTILLDPIPDVRSIAAKALGSLTRGLGEDALPDLRPWLVERLRAEGGSSAERSGAAQGLTEVLIASGTSVVESVMLDDILPLKSHPSPSTREGVLWVLTFLPPALGHGFTPLLDLSLPALISGLSDDNEQVREVAMRAGRVMIKSHGRGHVDTFLPILEGGMGDEDYRIRVSSLMLLGDLLSMIAGTTVLKTDGDTQEDIRRAERAQAQLTLALGMDTRNRIFSGLYLLRSDSASAVRQGAIQVWKTVVSVTARTLRQILPVLVKMVVADLASGNIEKTEIAGKCLGDIVSKLGDSVLPEIIPVLRNSLTDGDAFTRRGVCVGLSEVITCSTKDQILRFIDIIVKVVQDALCDDDEDVRELAATSFQNLHFLIGNRAMDEVVPALMVALESSSSDETRRVRALNGLTGILGIRSRELLPYIIPRLIERPITLNHARALTGIAAVTGDTIYYHFSTILPALMNDLAAASGDDEEREEAVRECAKALFANVDTAGVNMLMSEIAGKCGSDKVELRRESCLMLESVITERKDVGDFYDQAPIIIRELVYRFNDEHAEVLKAANKAFAALSKHVPAEELVKHVEFLRNLIASMVSTARRQKGGVGDGEFLLPGFNIPKGLEPLLPIYQRGILYGTPTIREASAAGLGEVISLTATKFLAGPLIIKMTGPLLRIVGDRNPSNVKIAILRTLGLILVKGGPALRAFVPQFQTTFVKALSDPSRQVRMEAIGALGLLMPLSTRVDPLLKELVAGSLGKNSTSADTAGAVAVQTATLDALAVVLQKGGSKAKLPDSIPSALDASKVLLFHVDEYVREAAAKVLGAACDLVGSEETAEVIQKEIISGKDDESSEVRQGKACAIRRIFSASVSKDLDASLTSEMRNVALKYMKDDKTAVKEAGCIALGAAIGRSNDPAAALRKIEPELLAIMNDTKERMEYHIAVAQSLCLALTLSDVPDRVEYFGRKLLDACLTLALSSAQRTQFAYHDVLFLALDTAEGKAGLDKYASSAMFDDARKMKSLYTKVLYKIKAVTVLKD